MALLTKMPQCAVVLEQVCLQQRFDLALITRLQVNKQVKCWRDVTSILSPFGILKWSATTDGFMTLHFLCTHFWFHRHEGASIPLCWWRQIPIGKSPFPSPLFLSPLQFPPFTLISLSLPLPILSPFAVAKNLGQCLRSPSASRHSAAAKSIFTYFGSKFSHLAKLQLLMMLVIFY